MTEFRIAIDSGEFLINGTAFCFRTLEDLSEFNPPVQQLIGGQVRKVREWIWAFRWQVLEQLIQCSRR
jgi:hypothetical protein